MAEVLLKQKKNAEMGTTWIQSFASLDLCCVGPVPRNKSEKPQGCSAAVCREQRFLMAEVQEDQVWKRWCCAAVEAPCPPKISVCEGDFSMGRQARFWAAPSHAAGLALDFKILKTFVFYFCRCSILWEKMLSQLIRAVSVEFLGLWGFILHSCIPWIGHRFCFRKQQFFSRASQWDESVVADRNRSVRLRSWGCFGWLYILILDFPWHLDNQQFMWNPKGREKKENLRKCLNLIDRNILEIHMRSFFKKKR